MKKNKHKQIFYTSHHIATYGGNVAFWDYMHLSEKIFLYTFLTNSYKSTRSGCFFYDNKTINKNNKDISIKEKLYNLLEQFVPLIGGGEFRWYFKHLSDQI